VWGGCIWSCVRRQYTYIYTIESGTFVATELAQVCMCVGRAGGGGYLCV